MDLFSTLRSVYSSENVLKLSPSGATRLFWSREAVSCHSHPSTNLDLFFSIVRFRDWKKLVVLGRLALDFILNHLLLELTNLPWESDHRALHIFLRQFKGIQELFEAGFELRNRLIEGALRRSQFLQLSLNLGFEFVQVGLCIQLSSIHFFDLFLNLHTKSLNVFVDVLFDVG